MIPLVSKKLNVDKICVLVFLLLELSLCLFSDHSGPSAPSFTILNMVF